MEIIRNTDDMVRWSAIKRTSGQSIALVPTMGYFHAGHLALMERAGTVADQVVVSLFVNPAQFAPGEDLATYPRSFAEDVAKAEGLGVAALFSPTPQDMYPAGFQTTVTVTEITKELCGKNRPHHFAGVTTVVNKLFNLVQPRVAVFGEKDFQQVAVIRRMVTDLHMPVEILGHPIVREKDGLAMSSRNSYLDKTQRQQALCLWHSLQEARQHVLAGERRSEKIKNIVQAVIENHGPCHIDYIEFIDKNTLESRTLIDENGVLALAVRIGKIRLIDNGSLLRGEYYV